MDTRAKIDTMLNRPMDRREFLKYLGLGFLAITAFGPVVKLLLSRKASNPVRHTPAPQTATSPNTYGTGPMGSTS